MKEPSLIDKATLWNRERPLTPDEQKRLRRVNFALRAKNDFGKAK